MQDVKLQNLIENLKGLESVLVAFSGGMDSALLLNSVKLSGIRAIAATASSPIMPENELKNAKKAAKELKIEHKIIETGELTDENFLNNTPDRCFYCKDKRYEKFREIASKNGLKTLIDGTNIDDKGDYRPGIKAALKHGVRSPLLEAGFTKEDINNASLLLGLPVRPSSSCLATRFPYGTRLSAEGIKRVGDAEDYLRSLGFVQFRVRDHGVLARVEALEGDIETAIENRQEIAGHFKSLGYKFVSLDLEGFQSGSMNRLL